MRQRSASACALFGSGPPLERFALFVGENRFRLWTIPCCDTGSLRRGRLNLEHLTTQDTRR